MATPSPWPAPPTEAAAAPPPAAPGGLEADLLLDRRRLKRSRGLWRLLAILAVLGSLAAGAVALNGEGASLAAPFGGPHILRLTVSGTITDDRRLVEAIDRAAKSDSVRGMILAVDSPGGTVAGGEALHAALARFRAAKPLVATFGGTAASAGYMIAMPAERIFAREGSVTGSIGVLLQSFDAQDAMRSLGLRAEAITSGPLKDQPSPFRPLTEEGRAALRAVVQDLYDQFVRRVTEGRHMPEDRVRAVADGRIMTGRQALSAGLVDAIGGEKEARAHLASAHNLSEDLPVRDLRARDLRERTFGAAIGTALGETLAAALPPIVKTVVSEGLGGVLNVDGTGTLWQPPR
ncbi:signal peptide peptidase SppA [Roseomonas populi]|uniref:Signal peptide peptidase SppA n=1 Tax=Roseomonas populi TaxID=3121582 RepID=A0ABT1XDH2_9PROT|nr:signal peptide peptidase SppA [Roseomonas pecuniae]MCR0985779.1 signal peptide peptidase SppA [Roseomonas pecuniae]